MGIYSDGVSPWWGGFFDQPHSDTCRSTNGTYGDQWIVPAQPGDVFDIVFDGAYNTFLGLFAYSSNMPTTYYQYATTPGTGSLAGTYTAGFLGFTVPDSFTGGYLNIAVDNSIPQQHYLIAAIKTSSVGACAASTTTLCLDNNRFAVTTTWQKADGTSGLGTAIPLASDTGAFWFFSATNYEMMVKVLSGCSIDDRYWVFAGGLTNVAVKMVVTDTQTNATRTYTNPQGAPFQPLQDTNAFACP
jgi:hypothetical protein